jgi:hypothetical protein
VPELSALVPPNRLHLDELGDDVGLRGLAPGTPPEHGHSYATDDVCHGIRVDLLQAPVLGWAMVEPSLRRGLRFLIDSYDAEAGRFRSLRSADGAWLDAPGTEDTNGRALLALGMLIADCPDAGLRQGAQTLFERALPSASELSGLRARASLLLACDAAERGGLTGATSRAYQDVGNGLRQSFEVRDVTFDWPWPELVLSGENGLPAHALIVGGARLGYPRMLRMGLRAVEWLLTVQTAEGGHLTLIGDAGGWPRGGVRATADQRPIEATTLLLAADAAWRASGTVRFRIGLEAAYAWFLGGNDVSGMVADPDRGACHDGISADGVLPGQGTEATLMWLMAAEITRSHRAPPATAPVVRDLISATG